MTIGLPRALLYYRYKDLWETFFTELNCKIITSEETNKKILDDGINFSIDECCLPAKIYMGHVFSLIGKCDYILIPRVASYSKKNDVCVKFNALYDIVMNCFEQIKILDYNIDSSSGDNERDGFIHMGRILGYHHLKTLAAYSRAKKVQLSVDREKSEYQKKALKSFCSPKILIVSHPYNTYDKLIGYPISQYIKKLGGQPIYADAIDKRESIKKSKEISFSLYWLYNKELIGSIKMLEGQIDGVIFLTAFPCGPDSLVNELIMRKLKNIPMINIILDELQGEAGIQTRIESFVDIIIEKNKAMKRIV